MNFNKGGGLQQSNCEEDRINNAVSNYLERRNTFLIYRYNELNDFRRIWLNKLKSPSYRDVHRAF